MIEINDDMLGVWFVSWKGTDWMAGAWRTPSGPEGRYRFRYYRDKKAFNSEDEKSWYDLKLKEGAVLTNEEMVQSLSEMATLIEKANNGKKWELLRGASTFEQFTDEFMKLPFAHTKTLSLKECRFEMREKGTNVTVTAIHKATGQRACATGSAARKQAVKDDAVMELAMILYGGAPH